MQKWVKVLIVAVIALVAATIFLYDAKRVSDLKSERDRYKGNTQALLSDVEQYKVRDSLNAARVESLQLTVKEFERFRAEDAALIRELKERNRDLHAINSTQAETIIDLWSRAHDTVIVYRDSDRDSVCVPAVSLHCGDAWFDFDGILVENEFTGTLKNRDSLLLAETIKYKRFLGFLWKTRKIEDRRLDVVSKNPHTKIIGVEHVVLEK